MENQYIYPAIFHYGNDGISVSYPDLPGCYTYGENETNALKNAREALELHLFGLEEDFEEIPKATSIKNIEINDNETLILIDIWMLPIRDQMKNKAVKKTLTIPKWLNDIAIKNDINFSQLLQSAIKEYLGIKSVR